eukprot:1561977-Rhodomonas_salina.1
MLTLHKLDAEITLELRDDGRPLHGQRRAAGWFHFGFEHTLKSGDARDDVVRLVGQGLHRVREQYQSEGLLELFEEKGSQAGQGGITVEDVAEGCFEHRQIEETLGLSSLQGGAFLQDSLEVTGRLRGQKSPNSCVMRAVPGGQRLHDFITLCDFEAVDADHQVPTTMTVGHQLHSPSGQRREGVEFSCQNQSLEVEEVPWDAMMYPYRFSMPAKTRLKNGPSKGCSCCSALAFRSMAVNVASASHSSGNQTRITIIDCCSDGPSKSLARECGPGDRTSPSMPLAETDLAPGFGLV